MAQYVYPPSVVEQHAQRAQVTSYEHGYSEAARQASGKVLIIVLDRMIFKTATIIPDAAEWEECYNIYATGHALNFQPYIARIADLQAAGAEVR